MRDINVPSMFVIKMRKQERGIKYNKMQLQRCRFLVIFPFECCQMFQTLLRSSLLTSLTFPPTINVRIGSVGSVDIRIGLPRFFFGLQDVIALRSLQIGFLSNIIFFTASTVLILPPNVTHTQRNYLNAMT